MNEFEFSNHAGSMLSERNIPESWVYKALKDPDRTETHEDGTIHYIKVIEEFGNRYLRVIVNPDETPKKIVSQFFDRRLRSTS